ncbi:MAG: c-type cytochrome [Armatimonadetes bacterium]|nr:c-type cytochrome [Armatimonadota bacterium]
MKFALLFASLPLAAALVAYRAGTAFDNHVSTLNKALSFTVKFRSVTPGKTAEENTLTLSKPNLMRWESPSKLTVCDGVKITSYDKNSKTYKQVDFSADALNSAFSSDAVWAWGAFFNAELGKQSTAEKAGEQINQKGVMLKAYTLTRKNGPITVMIEAKSGLVRGATLKNGNEETFIQVTEMTVGTAALESKLFAWSAPEGATVASETPVGVPSAKAMTYADVRPIFQSACFNCHSGPNAKKGLDLSNYDNIINGGFVKPGDADRSVLVNAVRTRAMPPRGRLQDEQIEAIAKWVNDGAKP